MFNLQASGVKTGTDPRHCFKVRGHGLAIGGAPVPQQCRCFGGGEGRGLQRVLVSCPQGLSGHASFFGC